MENRLVNTVGEGEGGTNGESSLETYSTIWKIDLLRGLLSGIQRFATLWTVAPQAPLSMGLSRQEYCSRLPFPSPGM